MSPSRFGRGRAWLTGSFKKRRERSERQRHKVADVIICLVWRSDRDRLPCSSTVQVTYPSTGVVVDGAIGVGTAAGEFLAEGVTKTVTRKALVLVCRM